MGLRQKISDARRANYRAELKAWEDAENKRVDDNAAWRKERAIRGLGYLKAGNGR
jgi:hypothetical protein